MPKTALVTGATGSIGSIIASELEKAGIKVFKTGRKILNEENYMPFDLCNLNNVQALFDAAQSYLGHIDILINNAGKYIYKKIDEMKTNEIEQLTTLNFVAPYKLTSLAVNNMKKQHWGRIINIGSISSAVGEAGASLYSATKAGLTGMTKSLALELAQFEITVNQINPGWVDTNLTHKALSEDEISQTLDVIPQKRFIEPIEIAKLCMYLISDDARGLTGQSINLCAGLSVGC